MFALSSEVLHESGFISLSCSLPCLFRTATAAAASAAAATAIAGVPGVKVGPAALAGLSTMAFEEEVVTSPLCEPGLALGTIIEAKEGSTSGESEHGDSPEPPEPQKVPSVKKVSWDEALDGG